MKYALLALIGAAAISTSAFAVEPIEGSITYTKPDAVRFTKAPAGSTLSHEFYSNGQRFSETYVINENGSLTLLSRRTMNSN